ncbi:MAG: hypothetical protein IJ419_10095 [Agathobacter sp.]|nr:hypothetical protein [Agathobacter sp.]
MESKDDDFGGAFTMWMVWKISGGKVYCLLKGECDGGLCFYEKTRR